MEKYNQTSRRKFIQHTAMAGAGLMIANPVPMFAHTPPMTQNIATRKLGHNGATAYPSFNPDKKNPLFNYQSLHNAYDRIHAQIITTPIGNFTKAADYLDTIEFHDDTTWQPLKNKIVW
jgi:hypothetical protein